MADAETLAPTEANADDRPEKSPDADPPKSPFPLTPTPMERYMLADERRNFPMTYYVDIEYQGELNREALETSIDKSLERHPLLNARLAGGLWTHDAANPRPAVDWQQTRGLDEITDNPQFDLANEGPLRVAAGPGFIRISIHHATCDGVGALRFVGDLLAFYGQLTATGGAAPKLQPLDPAVLSERGKFDIRLPAPVSRGVATRAILRETWKIFSQRPVVLRVNDRPKQNPDAIPRRFQTTLNAADYASLCNRATDLQVSVNDLFLRDMFLTIVKWNSGQGQSAKRRWMRITMPTSLRGVRDTRMPATNVLGYALIARRENECHDPQELLTGLARDTKFILDWKMGAMFNESLRFAGKFPGAIWLGSRMFSRFATTVVSNLGDPTRRFRAKFPRENGLIRAGNILVTRLCGAPPVRPGTRSSVALFGYGDELTIGGCFDPCWFDPEHSTAFLEMYRAHLEATARG